MKPDWSGPDTIGIIATDAYGKTAYVTVDLVVDAVNDPPLLVAGLPNNSAAIDLLEGEPKNLEIQVSDVDNDVRLELTYSWTVNGDPVSGARTAKWSFETDADPKTDMWSAGTYAVVAKAADPSGAAVEYTWDIEVADLNEPPTAPKIKAPLANAKFVAGKAIVLQGDPAVDPDGDTLTYSWTIQAATGNATPTSIGDGLTATFSGKPALKPGFYTIVLTVDDGNGHTMTTSARIQIVKTVPPSTGFVPGFEAVLAFASIAVALAVAAGRRTRR